MLNTQKNYKAIQHPLAGSSFLNLVQLLLSNKITEPFYLQKALRVAFLSLSGVPLRIVEQLMFGRQISQTEIVDSPIFILGHWRSGTTYLHRLMIQDPNFGYVSSSQAFLPASFLLSNKFGKDRLNKIWPKTRDMDNCSYSPDVPEEEEYALGNMLPLSFYHCWFFPQNMKQLFINSVLLKAISTSSLKQWKRVYLQILKKTTFACNNQRLILKNPANTARIKILLEMFPRAKFIYIYRNPYDVFASTKNFYEKLLPKYELQKSNKKIVEENIFVFYQQLTERFIEEKQLIASENLIEIKYEDFEDNEVFYLKYIYSKFNLPNFETVQVRMQKYIDSQSNYQKNTYQLDEKTRAKISERWDFAIRKWHTLEEQII
jgi:omega-hydroxy-beta-dihydromenaquinone-9 sulfotransferase